MFKTLFIVSHVVDSHHHFDCASRLAGPAFFDTRKTRLFNGNFCYYFQRDKRALFAPLIVCRYIDSRWEEPLRVYCEAKEEKIGFELN